MNSKNDNLWMLGFLIVFLIFFTIKFGMTGLRTAGSIVLLFMVPFYLILNIFELSIGEKAIFSFFIGLGIFPTITYGFGFLVGIRNAIIITFVLLVIIGIVLNYMKKKHKTKQKQE